MLREASDHRAAVGGPLIEVRGLTKVFPRTGRALPGGESGVYALDDVDLDIRRGETLGLVGESGSGKSTLGRLILNLTRKTGGTMRFEGVDLHRASAREMRLLRRKMQIVFQDPYSSLHPRMTVGQTIMEGLRAGGLHRGAAADRRLEELVRSVGLGPIHLHAHPHQLSGGQRQRVAIARALSVQPSFIVLDEAVSALDVSIQAQMLNLLADLQAQRQLTYLFVSHDLDVIRYLSDRVAVLYRGRIVEQAPSAAFFRSPRHPYSRLLLSAKPGSGQAAAPPVNRGATPARAACQFVSRCMFAVEPCHEARPVLQQVGPDHLVACLRAAELGHR